VANTIRIKRSTGSSAPTSLANAELAFSEGNAVLHYGTGTGGAGGSATSIIKIGGAGAFTTLDTAQTISGNKTFTGTLDFSSATIATFATTGNMVVGGDLTVNGTTTTINSTTLAVDDKNIVLGDVETPTDSTADGGGFTLKGATDKTFSWLNSTDSWTSSEDIDLASGKVFRINGTSVLSGSTLGSGVTGSSLTSVGTLTSGVWNASTIGVQYGGTGATTLTGYVKGSGTSALTASATIPNTDISGLGTMSTQNSTNVSITGGTIDGITLDGGEF
jgi:hypothetical protein